MEGLYCNDDDAHHAGDTKAATTAKVVRATSFVPMSCFLAVDDLAIVLPTDDDDSNNRGLDEVKEEAKEVEMSAHGHH
jgi:predicted signal transduction protein with EAL and GGDEF domain